VRFRMEHPTFRRRHFLNGKPGKDGIRDVSWWHPAGHEMTEDDWNDAGLRTLGMLLSSTGITATDAEGHPITDSTLLLVFNGAGNGEFMRPAAPEGTNWRLVFTTAVDAEEKSRSRARKVHVQGSSGYVFEAVGKVGRNGKASGKKK